VLGASREHLPSWLTQGVWPPQPAQFALLGFACGLAFMLAELPNSFVKRQLDVVPGQPPSSPSLRAVFFVIDRCDSVLGVLIVASLLVPVQALTWVWVLVLGRACTPCSASCCIGWA
jgi:CDP-2,3-bis-(O-geranylgeranyl)-sn-glycerol synthase